ncbi:MAG: menaquinone-dependent protoporphyrinogen IX dehydrogenase [Niabella sp.]
MLTKAIIIYASVDGQTKKVCERIKDILLLNNHSVELFRMDELRKDVAAFDKVIIASSIRYGKHNERIGEFVEAHHALLSLKRTAFISVNLVARKAEKSKPDTNPYVLKFLAATKWKPALVGVFAGKLDYALYNFRDRMLIKLIMLITKGPVSSKMPIEYTNWEEVNTFGRQLCDM